MIKYTKSISINITLLAMLALFLYSIANTVIYISPVLMRFLYLK